MCTYIDYSAGFYPAISEDDLKHLKSFSCITKEDLNQYSDQELGYILAQIYRERSVLVTRAIELKTGNNPDEEEERVLDFAISELYDEYETIRQCMET